MVVKNNESVYSNAGHIAAQTIPLTLIMCALGVFFFMCFKRQEHQCGLNGHSFLVDLER